MIGKFTRFGLAACAVLAIGIPRPAAAQTSGDEWKFTAGLYVWLPTINADLKYSLPPGQPGSPDIEIGPNDYLTNLNIALPLVAELRKGNFALYTDVMYISVTAKGSHIKDIEVGPDRFPVPGSLEFGTETDVKNLLWTMVGGYTVAKGPEGNFDLFAGARYLHAKFETAWHLSADFSLPNGKVFAKTGSFGQSQDIVDGIVGFRGRFNAGEKWFFPYYADIGAGQSKVTWQLIAGAGYKISRVTDVVMVWRHLDYQGKNDKFLQRMTLGGPALAALFHL